LDFNFIAISETGRKSFSNTFLKNLCAGHDFIWHTKEPHGRSGGILLGVDLNVFDIGAIDEGDFMSNSYYAIRMMGSNGP